MKRFYFVLVLVFAGIIGQSCNIYDDSGYEKKYVVEAYLVADRNIPDVMLSHTVPADKGYEFSSTAVEGADISIVQLGPGNSIIRRVEYREAVAGIYKPNDSMTVKPRRTYRLQAVVDDQNTLTSTTTVPNAYQLSGNMPDTVVYQSEEQIEVTLFPDQPDTLSGQKHFVFNLIGINYLNAPLTPFYQDQLSEDDITREDFRNNSSGLVSEGNFEVQDDGSINIWVPWIGFAFYGPNKVVTNSIDDNLYDFIRTQSVQTGGSTLSPGEIPNVNYNIEGGIGIFGSIVTDTLSTFLVPPQQSN